MFLIEEDLTYYLLPCPHCGANAEDEDEPLHMIYNPDMEVYYCQCDRCGTMSDPAYFRDVALEAWQSERRDG